MDHSTLLSYTCTCGNVSTVTKYIKHISHIIIHTMTAILKLLKTQTPDERLLENADPFANASVCYESLWRGTTDNATDHRHQNPKETRTVALYYYSTILFTDNLFCTRSHNTYAY